MNQIKAKIPEEKEKSTMKKMDELDILSQNVSEGYDIMIFPSLHPVETTAAAVGVLAGTVITAAATIICGKKIEAKLRKKKKETEEEHGEI